MILPIYTLGQSVLRHETEEVTEDYPELGALIDNMFQTMYHAEGIGLAAPQVGLSLRLFVVDGTVLKEDMPDMIEGKRVFINPEITDESEEEVSYEEGCLSVPGIHEKVKRPKRITIHYFDENWNEHEDTFDGFFARMLQHEYDHLEGHVFTDHISPIRKQMISSRLGKIAKGKVNVSYKTK
ncbi:MAG: peptide deformylase [Paludibacteraceae bacterium]|mgnify:CR=1 FL=1|nr:peptide deformylase [Paludibacteraceae bacterium]